jgi:hypothetical protein
LITPGGDYMDRILGCGPAGLPQQLESLSRGPLGKCSSCHGDGATAWPGHCGIQPSQSHSTSVTFNLAFNFSQCQWPGDGPPAAGGLGPGFYSDTVTQYFTTGA